MEINTGTLVPSSMTDNDVKELIFNKLRLIHFGYKDIDELGNDYEDYLEEIKMQKLNDVWYTITDRVTHGEEGDLCDLTLQSDGTIKFFTQHYNGGGDWSDELEYNLKKLK